ncbi:flavodoxin domain-containing protein [Liquorilactobacillus satsumensis]|uniref:flavodoxin domain-containing protein n=1 Tax=Liquorilactobacillus satsumensis TaxID=259059 RepID=UPI0039EBF758
MKAVVVFASLTGNNLEIAEFISKQLKAKKINTDLREISQCDPFSLKNVDLIIIVSYTYAAGNLPLEALNFYEDLENTVLTNIVFGITGSGDSWYGNFGKAVLKFDREMAKTGALRGASPLLIDDKMTISDQNRLSAWLTKLIKICTNVN